MGSVACCGMREGISVEVSAADRDRLERIVADRNSPQKHVWRARIILATAQGCGTAEIMRRAAVSKPCVWRWQERFMREGVAGLVRDKDPQARAAAPAAGRGRSGGHADAWRSARRGRIGPAAQWRRRAACRCARCSASGRRTAYRVRRFKLSTDPAFAAKLRDVVGLYLDPPAHSLVLSADEKLPREGRPVAPRPHRLLDPGWTTGGMPQRGAALTP
jgi:Homeodomain-like domain